MTVNINANSRSANCRYVRIKMNNPKIPTVASSMRKNCIFCTGNFHCNPIYSTAGALVILISDAINMAIKTIMNANP